MASAVAALQSIIGGVKAQHCLLRCARNSPAISCVDRSESEATFVTRDRTMHGMKMPAIEVDRLMEPDRVIEARARELTPDGDVGEG